MNRRSTEISGWVNFPIDDQKYKHTKEGGMFVKLVVVDDHDMDSPKAFAQCCGVQVYDLLGESFVGDDKTPKPKHPNTYDSDVAFLTEMKQHRKWEENHFPRLGDNTLLGLDRYMSRPYLASIIMGSTGWSGWDDEKGEVWNCTLEDLNIDGKFMYSMVQTLYPNATLHLLTFLDT